MQGLVTIDFGNTNPHAGIFQKNDNQWKLLKVVPWPEIQLYLNQFQLDAHNSSLVIAEVKNRDQELLPLLEKGFLLTRIKEYWKGNRFAGMPVHYAPTLGEDRLIEAFHTFKNQPGQVLIINAGTFVTMDVVTPKGFQGGYIVPGMKTYFKIFSQAELLKDVALTTGFKNSLPGNTSEAITESYTAFAALANKIIKEHNISKIIISGGETAVWHDLLCFHKLPVVVETSPHLIHWALQFWMTTQIERL